MLKCESETVRLVGVRETVSERVETYSEALFFFFKKNPYLKPSLRDSISR